MEEERRSSGLVGTSGEVVREAKQAVEQASGWAMAHLEKEGVGGK